MVDNKDAKKFELPEPTLPDLATPEAPKAGLPKDAPHVSCEGEVYKKMESNEAVLPPPPGKARILIALPILSYTHEFVQSFLKFWTQLCTAKGLNFEAGYHFMYRKPVHMAEQAALDIAMFNKCTHILFADDDIYDYSINDLKKLLEADKDVIGGVMYASKFPHAMCVFRRYNTDKKVIDMPSDNSMYRLYEVPCQCHKCGIGLSHWDAKFCPACGAENDNILQKADLLPFCFTLMKLSIFEKMKKPYFHCEIEYPADSWFSDRCIEAGIQQWGHMAVRLNHAGCNDLTKPHMFNMGLAQNQASQRGIVNVSQEEMQKHQFLLNNKMKEAEDKLKVSDVPEFITPQEPEGKDECKKTCVTDDIPKEESVKVPS